MKNRLLLALLIRVWLLGVANSAVSPEECDIIGAPDSAGETRTCTFIKTQLEDTQDQFSCAPSQEWLEANINQSITRDLIETCSNAASVGDCPLLDSELDNKCMTDFKESSCLSPPNLVVFELLHGLVDTYPELRQNALEFPKLCAVQTRNISCLAIEGCIWVPFEEQYANGDILIKTNVSDQEEAVVEVQRLTLEKTTHQNSANREVNLVLSAHESDKSMVSFLIERSSAEDTSFTFQLAYNGQVSAETFSFNSDESAMRSVLLSLMVLAGVENSILVITRTQFRANTVLYEFEFSSEEIATRFDVLQILSQGAAGANEAIKIRHAINKQRIYLKKSITGFSLNIVYYGPSKNQSLPVTETTNEVDLQSWFNSLTDIRFAQVKLISAPALQDTVVYEVKFLSRIELFQINTAGVLLPNEFLLGVENPVNIVSADVSYVVQNPGLNPNGVLKMSLCEFKEKISGLAEISSGTKVINFFGYSSSSLILPVPNEMILIAGQVSFVERVIMATVETDYTYDKLTELYRVELSNVLSFNNTIAEHNSLFEVFRCNSVASEVFRVGADNGIIQQALRDMYVNVLDGAVDVAVTSGQTLDQETALSISISSESGSPSLKAELYTMPFYEFSDKPMGRSTYSHPLKMVSRYFYEQVPNFRIAFSGYLQSDELGLRAVSFRTHSAQSTGPYCLTTENNTDFGPRSKVLNCDEYDYFSRLRETRIVCFSSVIQTFEASDLAVGLNSICNLASASIRQTSIEALSFDIYFNTIRGSLLENPFELLVDNAADVPQLYISYEESFEGSEAVVLAGTVTNGKGTLLSLEEAIPHEEFVGDRQNNPCIVSFQQREQTFEDVGEDEIEALSSLDNQMFICADRDYEDFLKRHEQGMILPSRKEVSGIMDRERCHSIQLPIDDGEFTNNLCVWRGNVSESNSFAWSNVTYSGVSSDVIFSPCTVPLKIKTRRLMRVYRLFKTEADQFPGYDNNLGSSIKGDINSFLNQDGRCSTPQDETEFTSVFTRSWQLIITHCVYVSSAVYAVAGFRLVYVLNSAKGTVWALDFQSFKLAARSVLFVFFYMMFGTLYVCLVFCIPAAVLAKFIGSESTSETILMSLGQTAALIILYLDLGFFIKDK